MALKDNPDNWKALLNYALVMLDAGDKKEAELGAREVLRIYPGNTEALEILEEPGKS